MKCTNCIAEAVKTEDFAIFDCLKEQNFIKEVNFVGFIRYSLCHKCIENQLKQNLKDSLIFRMIFGVGMIVMLILALFAAVIFDVISLDTEMLFYGTFGGIVIIGALIAVRPKNNTINKKFYKEFETHPISQLLSNESINLTDFGILNYHLLFDKESGSNNPNDRLTGNKINFFRYCFPISENEDKFSEGFKIPLSSEDVKRYMQIYEKVK